MNVAASFTDGVIEVLAWHRQAVIPPTIHPKTGKPYRWRDESRTLFNTALTELPIITDAAVDAIRAAFGIKTVAEEQRAEHKKHI